MPRGSCSIDFAFAVHTHVGSHCIGAKVNGRIVPLKATLKSGDQVEIITSTNQEPHQDWLSFVKTAKARHKIRKYLREVQFTQTLKLGEEILIKYLKKYELDLSSPDFQGIVQKLGFQNLDSLMLALGRGEYTPENITKKLFPDKLSEKKSPFYEKYIKRARSGMGIMVQGMDNMLINFGKCCQPVPGDKIIGYITKGKGVTVHRIDCNNMLNFGDDLEKRISVAWDIEKDHNYQVHLSILSEDRRDLLRDISPAISKKDTNIIMVEFKLDDTLVKGNLVVEITDLHQLTKVIQSISKVKGIISVERVESPTN
jgi:GTP pyrophosphokinase